MQAVILAAGMGKRKKGIGKTGNKVSGSHKSTFKTEKRKGFDKRCSGGFCRKDICLSGKTDRSFVYGYG